MPLTTVDGTLLIHDLATHVGAGVLTACVLFARRVARLVSVTSASCPGGVTRASRGQGPRSYASSLDVETQFDDAGRPVEVHIESGEAELPGASMFMSRDAITYTNLVRCTQVEVIGLDDGQPADRSERHSERLAGVH